MQHKTAFKQMTEKERKAFLKTVPKRASTAPVKKKVVSYLQLNKTVRPVTVSTEFDDKFNNSMKRYHNHINNMVALGFSNPTEPTFRNDVVSNMKEFYSNNPAELVPMHNKEWIVDDIVAKMVKKHMKESVKKMGQTKTTMIPKKTKAVLEARRHQRKATAAATKKKVLIKSPNSVPSNNNNNNGGFNMNKMNNNNNNGTTKSNNNNNNNMSNNNNSNKNSTMSNNDVKKLMNNLKKINMSVLRV
jgi:hypothetical protein